MKILVTGGIGFIGSHVCVELLSAGHGVVIVDNRPDLAPEALEAMGALAGSVPRFLAADVRNRAQLADILSREGVEAVVHLAALKSVAESCRQPLEYFDHNVHGTLALLQAMQETRVRLLVFSSSASVYGNTGPQPVHESAPLRPLHPYARSKAIGEAMVGDLVSADVGFHAAILRYFNCVGAHSSGVLGERPDTCGTSLLPRIARIACGQREHLTIYGNDFPTPDGTGIRDYVHVQDVARAHVRALDCIRRGQESFVTNLGSGRGWSVLQVVRAFERASGRAVPIRYAARRPGDIASSCADPRHAEHHLGWRAQRGIESMCEDVWRWQSRWMRA